MNKLTEKAQQDSTVLWLLIAVVFMLGVLMGLICSPVKNGISIGNDNTIIGGANDDDDNGKCKKLRKDEDISF